MKRNLKILFNIQWINGIFFHQSSMIPIDFNDEDILEVGSLSCT
jgi:hypothetical protein